MASLRALKNVSLLPRARCYATSSARWSASAAAAPTLPAFTTLTVSPLPQQPLVFEVVLSRPAAANAMTSGMFSELEAAFTALGARAHPCRAIVLRGAGKMFSAGLDLVEHAPLLAGGGGGGGGGDPARRAWLLRDTITAYQRSVNAVEACLKPVIAAVHGGCIGGGVDLVAAADIRVASGCAYFAVAEAQLGLAADLGSLQRLPAIMGSDSLAREMALTARRVAADEALRAGLLSAVLVDAQALLVHAHALAARIAALSPVAVQGTKLCMNFSRGRPAGDGLAFTAAHNAAMLQTSDIAAAAGAAFGGKAAASFPPL